MSKKTLWICVLVLVLLAVGIFVWKSCSSGGAGTEEQDPQKLEDGVKTEDAAQGPEDKTPAEETGTGETETESAQLIESEGDLIITIPDDEESDGF